MTTFDYSKTAQPSSTPTTNVLKMTDNTNNRYPNKNMNHLPQNNNAILNQSASSDTATITTTTTTKTTIHINGTSSTSNNTLIEESGNSSTNGSSQFSSTLDDHHQQQQQKIMHDQNNTSNTGSGNDSAPIASSPAAAAPCQQASSDPVQLSFNLQRQLEYYFSRQNLANDTYLVSQMDPDLYVPISIIAKFKRVVDITTDIDLIVSTLRNSNVVIVDESGTKVKPNISVQRTTVILRDLPEATEKEIHDFLHDIKSPSIKSIKKEIGNMWYITFESEDDALKMLYETRGKTFKDCPVAARMKSEPVVGSIQARKTAIQQDSLNSSTNDVTSVIYNDTNQLQNNTSPSSATISPIPNNNKKYQTYNYYYPYNNNVPVTLNSHWSGPIPQQNKNIPYYPYQQRQPHQQRERYGSNYTKSVRGKYRYRNSNRNNDLTQLQHQHNNNNHYQNNHHHSNNSNNNNNGNNNYNNHHRSNRTTMTNKPWLNSNQRFDYHSNNGNNNNNNNYHEKVEQHSTTKLTNDLRHLSLSGNRTNFNQQKELSIQNNKNNDTDNDSNKDNNDSTDDQKEEKEKDDDDNKESNDNNETGNTTLPSTTLSTNGVSRTTPYRTQQYNQHHRSHHQHHPSYQFNTRTYHSRHHHRHHHNGKQQTGSWQPRRHLVTKPYLHNNSNNNNNNYVFGSKRQQQPYSTRYITTTTNTTVTNLPQVEETDISTQVQNEDNISITTNDSIEKNNLSITSKSSPSEPIDNTSSERLSNDNSINEKEKEKGDDQQNKDKGKIDTKVVGSSSSLSTTANLEKTLTGTKQVHQQGFNKSINKATTSLSASPSSSSTSSTNNNNNNKPINKQDSNARRKQKWDRQNSNNNSNITNNNNNNNKKKRYRKPSQFNQQKSIDLQSGTYFPPLPGAKLTQPSLENNEQRTTANIEKLSIADIVKSGPQGKSSSTTKPLSSTITTSSAGATNTITATNTTTTTTTVAATSAAVSTHNESSSNLTSPSGTCSTTSPIDRHHQENGFPLLCPIQPLISSVPFSYADMLKKKKEYHNETSMVNVSSV